MELLKALLALITSFFQSKTAKSKEEISLADKTEEAVVEKMRATQNAEALAQQQKIDQSLAQLDKKQKEELRIQEQKTLDEQLNDQFGKDQ